MRGSGTWATEWDNRLVYDLAIVGLNPIVGYVEFMTLVQIGHKAIKGSI